MDEAVYRRMAQVQASHWWYEGRRRILGALIKSLRLPADAKIMEAGCGPGANLDLLKTFGAVQAFEPDGFAVDHAARTYGVDVKTGSLPFEIPFAGPFDLIGAFDVIEHVEADRDSLRTLATLVKPGGYALFTVPAHMFLWSEHDVVNHHKRRYTLGQFRSLLMEAGFEVQFISYYNITLFPIVASVRFVKKLLRIRNVPDEAMPGLPFVNRALTAVFGAERFVLRFIPLPFGVSIVAVCHRS